MRRPYSARTKLPWELVTWAMTRRSMALNSAPIASRWLRRASVRAAATTSCAASLNGSLDARGHERRGAPGSGHRLGDQAAPSFGGRGTGPVDVENANSPRAPRRRRHARWRAGAGRQEAPRHDRTRRGCRGSWPCRREAEGNARRARRPRLGPRERRGVDQRKQMCRTSASSSSRSSPWAHVHQDAAEGAAQRLRERQVVGRVTFVDVEPVGASERRRVEPAAQAADVVADEEVRAVLRDAADLAALEAARALGRGDQLHVPPPMTSGARRLARTSTPASVGENTTSWRGGTAVAEREDQEAVAPERRGLRPAPRGAGTCGRR
jgi:hypothetical protein